MSGLWLKNVGYGQKEIADAAYEQMLKITYMPMGTTTEPTVMLSDKIASMMPGDLSRCFFTSGGSESVETALKLSRAYFKRIGEPQRTKFISRRDSYHGATMGAMALGGNYLYPREDYEPLMPNTFHAPQPNFYHCEFNSASPEGMRPTVRRRNREHHPVPGTGNHRGGHRRTHLQSHGSGGAAGQLLATASGTLRQVRLPVDADEVITGFGRTGKWFGCDHWGIVPDMMTVAKGITSGYIPMGGTILRKHIADAFVGSPRAAFRHVITFGGHPVAAAASLKNLEIMEREGMVENSARMGKYLLDGFEELKAKTLHHRQRARHGPHVRDGVGKGPGNQGTLPGRRRPGSEADPGLCRQRAFPARRRPHEHHAAAVRHAR